MELLSVQKARSVWLLDGNDLNPRGRERFSESRDWLKDTYHFTKVPESVADLDDNKSLYFAGGYTVIRDERIMVEIRIYNDGIVGETRSSTEDSDFFLSELLDSYAQKFSSPYTPAIVRKKMYVSELNVRTEKNLASFNPKLEKFSEILSAAVGGEAPMRLAGLSFWSDSPPTPLQVFRFERKHGVEFSDNRYFTTAPLQTDKHLILLEELELALS